MKGAIAVKDYLKPSVEYIKFVTEDITDLIDDSQTTGDNNFGGFD